MTAYRPAPRPARTNPTIPTADAAARFAASAMRRVAETKTPAIRAAILRHADRVEAAI